METEKKGLNWDFWRDQKLKKLIILNPDDFKPPAIAKNLETKYGDAFFESLGLSDQKEIIERNELMKFMFTRPELMMKINQWEDSLKKLRNLPDNENDFLFFYEKENPYWKILHDFVAEIRGAGDCPKKLLPFIEMLEEAIQNLEHLEKDMADKIGQKLKRVTKMEGVIDLLISGFFVHCRDSDDEEEYEPVIIGQKSFSSVWASDYKAHIPTWIKNWIFSFIGVKALWQRIANAKAAKKALRSSIIETFPTSIKLDLKQGIRNLLKLDFCKEASYSSEESLKNHPDYKIFRFLEDLPSTRLKLYFHYDAAGMWVTPINITSNLRSTYEIFSENRVEDEYTGYTQEERDTIIKNLDKINQEVSESLASNQAMKTKDFMSKNLNITIGNALRIEALETDSEFRWFYIMNLYRSDEHKETYVKLINNRHKFCDGINELKKLGDIIKAFKETAKQKDLPICMPEITTEKIGIAFKEMGPIDMMEQNNKMVTFSFPEINGHIICLTGKHGRGKSVAGNSVLENLWLAQSGLPVFAQYFRTDIKEMIGAITNDTGEGSTATVFGKKALNLFANIQKVPAHKSLIFIDEIGKGTQEKSGFELGKRILRTLNHNGNSVIFNTQIMALAEYARDNHDAICLKADNEHQFQPGIGEGMMEDLIREIGLDKYLN